MTFIGRNHEWNIDSWLNRFVCAFIRKVQERTEHVHQLKMIVMKCHVSNVSFHVHRHSCPLEIHHHRVFANSKRMNRRPEILITNVLNLFEVPKKVYLNMHERGISQELLRPARTPHAPLMRCEICVINPEWVSFTLNVPCIIICTDKRSWWHAGWDTRGDECTAYEIFTRFVLFKTSALWGKKSVISVDDAAITEGFVGRALQEFFKVVVAEFILSKGRKKYSSLMISSIWNRIKQAPSKMTFVFPKWMPSWVPKFSSNIMCGVH